MSQWNLAIAPRDGVARERKPPVKVLRLAAKLRSVLLVADAPKNEVQVALRILLDEVS